MGFSGFAGQGRAVKIIKGALEKGELNHAFLLVGPPETGKHTFALLVARALHCPVIPGDCCDTCPSCQKIIRGIHPDVEEVSPGGSRISIEQVRQVIKVASYEPQEGPGKIYIIKDAHLMTPQAANSLLKTLEEPPPYLFFVLLAPDIRLLPQTIASRCQLIPFSPVPTVEIVTFLRETRGQDYPEKEMKVAANLAEGRVGRAINMLASPGFREQRNAWAGEAIRFLSLPPGEVFHQVEELARGKDPGGFMDFLESFIRDCLVYSQAGEEMLINLDYLEEIREEVVKRKDYSPGDWLMMLKSAARYKKRAHLPLNKKVALEALQVKMREGL